MDSPLEVKKFQSLQVRKADESCLLNLLFTQHEIKVLKV